MFQERYIELRYFTKTLENPYAVNQYQNLQFYMYDLQLLEILLQNAQSVVSYPIVSSTFFC